MTYLNINRSREPTYFSKNIKGLTKKKIILPKLIILKSNRNYN